MVIKLKQMLLTIALSSLVTGCVNGYKDFYTPATGATSENIASHRLSPAPAIPSIEHATSTDAKAIISSYEKRGYLMIGFSSFNSPNSAPDRDAVKQGASVGADLVVTLPAKYTGSTTSVVPFTTPTATTSYTNSTATAYGTGGTVTAYGNSTTTTNGTQTTYIPITQNRSDYGAIYFIKARFIFGATYRELDDSERQQLQTNRGLVVLTVVDNTPAYSADVLTNDIIVSLDNTAVTNIESFSNMINSLRGKTVTVSIIRNGQKLIKTVTLNN